MTKGSLEERVQLEAAAIMAAASRLPDGPDREALGREFHQSKKASETEEWLNSPGLGSPLPRKEV